jgi:hypothetical protein
MTWKGVLPRAGRNYPKDFAPLVTNSTSMVRALDVAPVSPRDLAELHSAIALARSADAVTRTQRCAKTRHAGGEATSDRPVNRLQWLLLRRYAEWPPGKCLWNG